MRYEHEHYFYTVLLPTAKRNHDTRTLSRWGKKGARVREENKRWREWVLDQLHHPRNLNTSPPDSPAMNADGDIVPLYTIDNT